jgi:hypothetical protein
MTGWSISPRWSSGMRITPARFEMPLAESRYRLPVGEVW